VANRGIAFQGAIVLGLGFAVEPEVARALIVKDVRNADVLFPYLNGQDLNSTPDGSASRWIINFREWSQERAATYRDCFEIVERLVRPERLQRDAVKYPRMVNEWWKYWNARPGLMAAIAGLERVIALTRHSKVVMPAFASAMQVIGEAIAVFATDDTAMLALLSSAPHYWWTIERASTLETRIRYTPSDVFETFARPELSEELRGLGDRLDTFRRELMLARQAGLTATYNLVHDEARTDSDIAELRRIHVAIDEEVARCYGWTDLDLDHGFHDTRQGPRFTVGPVARQEILDRLLELNHERYAAEVAAGLHARKKGKAAKPAPEGLF
jgi:hypothetical protein